MLSFPTLITANVPKIEMGKVGFELLLYRMNNPNAIYRHIQLNAEIFVRSSVADPSQYKLSLNLRL
jgi:DNA-binding LacI/PurR family transcriptional regulator